MNRFNRQVLLSFNKIKSIFQLVLISLNQVVTLFGAGCGLISMITPGGTIDKILNGGAGKSGSTVAVSLHVLR